jgi:hypothetical protein
MTGILFAGALVGLGLFLLVRALVPVRPGVAAALGAIEAGRIGPGLAAGASPWQRARFELGSSVRDTLASRGFKFTSLR